MQRPFPSIEPISCEDFMTAVITLRAYGVPYDDERPKLQYQLQWPYDYESRASWHAYVYLVDTFSYSQCLLVLAPAKNTGPSILEIAAIIVKLLRVLFNMPGLAW